VDVDRELLIVSGDGEESWVVTGGVLRSEVVGRRGGRGGLQGWRVGGLEDVWSFASIGNLLCCLALVFMFFNFSIFLGIFIKGGNRH